MSEQEHPSDAFVTVFESDHHDAESEAEMIHGLLASAELESVIVRDNVPELPTGRVEVRVFASNAASARQLIEEAQKGAADKE